MKKWIKLSDVIGTERVPLSAAIIIQTAIEKAERAGDISGKNRWQLIEYLCADYLAGSGE